jgi:hypothetical protein
MIQTLPHRPDSTIQATIDHILAVGQINSRQYSELVCFILANPSIATQERCLIHRIFDLMQIGRLRRVD